ncbi:uncharacterized protein LOC124271444 [Haliotis rubra]|uniref:uncharacterized protein LOC124271444 n=1 Tax=Haliotis rubra TaxID=36100 RepID=UPI001EE589BB|nr:uncharacterized protein LOC124271444 [Haliotis rubra]
MHDVYVEVFSDNNDSPGFCSSHDGVVGAGETIRLTCDPPQFGRHVRLSRPTTSSERFAVCEMQVFGYRSPQQCSRYVRKVGVRLNPVNFTSFQGETTLPACGNACHGSAGCIGFNYNEGEPCMLVHRHAGFTEDSEWSVFLLQQC